jgi:2,4-dienoyl-CoA reductase-like NADH-dependent reductase (Old Yellow Enzyme family)
MKKIFENAQLGNLKIPNRLVRSATMEMGLAKKGIITNEYKAAIEELALGGAGLIITGMIGVAPNSETRDAMVKIYDPNFVPLFSDVTKAVHEAGSAIVVQLGHCGAKAKMVMPGAHISAPSDVHLAGELPAKAMTKDEINALVKAYGEAALRCKEAGADGVQFHGAHGYLISQFMSPYFNKRADEYGGSIENRARLLFEAYDEIRAKTGSSYPVMIKSNYSDLVDPGIAPNEINWVCAELSKRGIDAIEVSAGLSLSADSRPSKVGFKTEGYFGGYALDVAANVSCAVIAVGGFRTFDFMQDFVNKAGNIEAVALCRPFIRQPDLANCWKADSSAKCKCISCNQCFTSPMHGCYVDKYATGNEN